MRRSERRSDLRFANQGNFWHCWGNYPRCLGLIAMSVLLVCGLMASASIVMAAEEKELSYLEYQTLVISAHRLDKLAVMEPFGKDVGMFLVLGDRYGLVHVYHLTHNGSEELWKSKQLNGLVEEVQVVDLDGDGYDDSYMAWTSAAMVYVWNAEDFRLSYESLTSDFEKIHSFTSGNVDDDEAIEIIINADKHIHYLDGVSFNIEWTSLREYEATRMLCGDVDGDRRNEIILNTGQVLDSRTGDVEWADEVFGSRIQLLDMDGDEIPEILTESDGTVMKVFDADRRLEKHMQ